MITDVMNTRRSQLLFIFDNFLHNGCWCLQDNILKTGVLFHCLSFLISQCLGEMLVEHFRFHEYCNRLRFVIFELICIWIRYRFLTTVSGLQV
jgi:hypothetical protein